MATTSSQRSRTAGTGPGPRPRARGTPARRRRARSQRDVVGRAVEARRPTRPASRRRARAVGQPADHGDRQVLDGAGRRLGDRRGDVDGPVPGQDDAGHAGALGRAQEGAEVARVGDAVERHEERRPCRRRAASQVVEVGLGQRCGEGEHALGRVGAGLRRRSRPCPRRRPAPGSAAASSRMSSRIGDVVEVVGHPRPRGPGAARRAAARAPPGGPRPGRRRGPVLPTTSPAAPALRHRAAPAGGPGRGDAGRRRAAPAAALASAPPARLPPPWPGSARRCAPRPPLPPAPPRPVPRPDPLATGAATGPTAGGVTTAPRSGPPRSRRRPRPGRARRGPRPACPSR